MSKNLPESQCAQEKSPPEELLAFDLSFFALGILTSFEGSGQLDTPLLQDGLRDGVGLIPGSSLRRYSHDTRLTRLCDEAAAARGHSSRKQETVLLNKLELVGLKKKTQ